MPFLYSNTKPIPMNPQSLPAGIEQQLTDLELRHKRHQAMLDDHHEAKHERRKRHREGWHKRKLAPIHLCYH